MTTLIRPTTGSPAERFTSRDPQDFPVPRGREEEWRFTPVRRIREFFEPFDPDADVTFDVVEPDGAVVKEFDRADVPAFGTVLVPADRTAAIAQREIRRVLSVRIPSETELSDAVVVTRTGRGGRGYEGVVVELGAYARATVVLDNRGALQESATAEYFVGDGASLTVVIVNDADTESVRLAAHAARVGRDAWFRQVAVNLGGALVRSVSTVQFAGPGGSAELLGLSLAGPAQHLETRLFVDHSVPNCTSDVLHKNALLGDTARTVWVGDVRIRPTATGTQTYELNRNLLLSDGARADSVPNLEIETGEIRGAGHASATGRFDDLQLFYLQSRGIPEADARRLVLRGFFADVVERIGLPELEQRLMAAVEERLSV